MKPRSIIGYALGFIGVLWVMATLVIEGAMHYRGAPELPRHLVYASLTFGAALGWWGFFWADSKRSLEGGGFLISAAERLRLARAGRRDTDPIVPVPVAASASDGVAAPAAPAQPVAPAPPIERGTP